MRKTFVWASSGVLALLVLGVYLTRTARHASAQSITLDRNLVALLPANATTLVGVDVDRLKGTALYRHIEAESQKGPGNSQFDNFTATTGFDPRRDVRELLVASWVDAAAKNQSQFVAVARGEFNVTAIGNEIKKEGKATSQTYRGFEVFLPDGNRKQVPKNESSTPHDQGAFAFLDTKTAIAGSRPAVLAAIDRKAGGGPSLLDNTSLLSRAQTISASSQVWAVSQSPGDVVAHAMPKSGSVETSNFARIFASMQNSTFAVDLMNGVDLRANGICKTSEDAKTLGDAARGFVAIGRLAASQKEPELMGLLDGIKVEEQSTELNISVRVDPATLDKLLEKKKMRGPVRSARL